MAIATYIDFLRRCVVWPSRMRGGNDSLLRRLAPASARRVTLRGLAAQPAGGHQPLPPRFTRTYIPQGKHGPQGGWRRKRREVCNG